MAKKISLRRLSPSGRFLLVAFDKKTKQETRNHYQKHVDSPIAAALKIEARSFLKDWLLVSLILISSYILSRFNDFCNFMHLAATLSKARSCRRAAAGCAAFVGDGVVVVVSAFFFACFVWLRQQLHFTHINIPYDYFWRSPSLEPFWRSRC
jgi:hypothetical protein